MVTYKYTAISHGGETITGIMEGFNKLDIVDRIKQSCDIILKLTPVKGEEEKTGILNMEIGGNKLNTKAFTVMCSQFAIILRSGVPLARTVSLIADKTTDKPLKKMLTHVAEDVEAGRSLSASFADWGGKMLPPTFVETIHAGEESGNIDRSFESMYQHFDKQVKMRGKVKSALAYPIFVLLLAVAVVIVLMVKVVPTFTAIFDSYGSELPLITKMLISISNFFQHTWFILLAILVVIVLFYKFFGNTEKGRMMFAKMGLKLPILGNINVLNGASQFANSMATLLGAGLPLTKAVNITAKTLDNYYFSTETGKLSGRLEEGHTLVGSMREADFMPDILVDMVGVGEETGEMESTLHTIALYYDSELEMATDSALKKLEPALLVGLAVIAGFIVIAIYVAMFEMYAVM